MASTLSAVLALVLCAGTTYAASLPGRIVGGEDTTIDRYPSIVQLEHYSAWTAVWSQSCGANILNRLYVVTAAHCTSGNVCGSRRVRAGTTNRNIGGVLHNCFEIIIHPSYGQNGLDGDISIIRLEEPFTYTPVVQPGTIIAQGIILPDNVPVVHAGWGAISQGGPASPVLQHVTVYTINNTLCAERYLTLPNPGVVTENMICVGLLDVGGRDACQGDSGGPLYYSNILVAVVSWGQGCAQPAFPGVNTAIAPYSNWIVNTAV